MKHLSSERSCARKCARLHADLASSPEGAPADVELAEVEVRLRLDDEAVDLRRDVERGGLVREVTAGELGLDASKHRDSAIVKRLLG
eukprot:CAMPEP_0115872898 /NCGR_PEP_ID=MMETSP0287-20121206/23685_1 /TAXON_ID=412157 /ORGANISM="Chrysochromulina rotalis, Strain UIO044" /LENGTH=86 /DNA_ID=CAMNT_0003327877 /DNA_START=21 /DNA_END=278 /DNA_ORIENTATION=+